MLDAFKKHLATAQLLDGSDKLLLAISGGLDSVVLAHLLKHSGLIFVMAHCNFGLRGAESDADEVFCTQWAEQLQVPIFTKRFDTEAYCAERGVSVQMGARELRYRWFNELADQQGYTAIVTAHHANDAVETFFLNLLRGTGIRGLRGIPQTNGRVRRPLLPFTKAMLLEYATVNDLRWREDQSNTSDAYARNSIRQQLLPLLESLRPGALSTLLANLDRFHDEASLLDTCLADKARAVVLQKEEERVLLDKHKLQIDPHLGPLLHYLLAPFGFSSAQQQNLAQHLRRRRLPGNVFYSSTHGLWVERQYISISSLGQLPPPALVFTSLEELAAHPGFELSSINNFSLPLSDELVLASDRLEFPLTVRPAKKGDRFQPFGMKGTRLLSDFFKDLKLDRRQKERCRLLLNGNGDIVWVMGYRSSEKYKVTATDKALIKLKISA